MLGLTESEAWEIFNSMKEIILSAEVLRQFSIIVPSLEHIKVDVMNMKNKFDSLLDALKSPIKVSSDVDSIISELHVHESAGLSYVNRKEDSELEQAILNNDKKIYFLKVDLAQVRAKCFATHCCIARIIFLSLCL